MDSNIFYLIRKLILSADFFCTGVAGAKGVKKGAIVAAGAAGAAGMKAGGKAAGGMAAAGGELWSIDLDQNDPN